MKSNISLSEKFVGLTCVDCILNIVCAIKPKKKKKR